MRGSFGPIAMSAQHHYREAHMIKGPPPVTRSENQIILSFSAPVTIPRVSGGPKAHSKTKGHLSFGQRGKSSETRKLNLAIQGPPGVAVQICSEYLLLRLIYDIADISHPDRRFICAPVSCDIGSFVTHDQYRLWSVAWAPRPRYLQCNGNSHQ